MDSKRSSTAYGILRCIILWMHVTNVRLLPPSFPRRFRWQSLLASVRPYLPLALFKKLPEQEEEPSWDGSDDEMESGRCNAQEERGKTGEGVERGGGGGEFGKEESGIDIAEAGSRRKLRRRFSYPRRLPISPLRCFGGGGTNGTANKPHGDSNEGEVSAGEEGLNGGKREGGDGAHEALIEKMDGGDREAVGRSELAYAERFFRHLYGDAVAHVQPIYPFHVVSRGERLWVKQE